MDHSNDDQSNSKIAPMTMAMLPPMMEPTMAMGASADTANDDDVGVAATDGCYNDECGCTHQRDGDDECRHTTLPSPISGPCDQMEHSTAASISRQEQDSIEVEAVPVERRHHRRKRSSMISTTTKRKTRQHCSMAATIPTTLPPLALLLLLFLLTTTSCSASTNTITTTNSNTNTMTSAIAKAYYNNRQAFLDPCVERQNIARCTASGGAAWGNVQMCCLWSEGECLHLDVPGCEEFGPVKITGNNNDGNNETLSEVPSPAPTPAWVTTFLPTTSPEPTQKPTRKPTASPETGEPTTGDPSLEPTRRPTDRPTVRPTMGPSVSPSVSPSKRPTPPPTNKPTVRPSKSPTLSPSSLPSIDSSGAPSVSPSASPTYQPTVSPTYNPTSSARPTPLIWPSASPTISAMPTTDPTGLPSFSPTESPTRSPSASPTTPRPTTAKPTTAMPTKQPVDAPVTEPTNSPTDVETSSPTTKPTVPLRSYDVDSTMVLYGANRLNRNAREAWVEETEERIRDETLAIIGDEGGDLVVTVTFVGQGALESQRRVLTVGKYIRRLQTSPLQINFSTSITFRSEEENWNPNEMVAAGFRSPADQAAYISSLKGADYTSFQYVETMQMEVEGKLITETEDDEQLKANTNNYYIIIGAVGGGLLLLLAGGMYYRKKKRGDEDVLEPLPQSFSKTNPQDQPTTAGSRTSQPPPPPPKAFNPQQQQQQQQLTQQQLDPPTQTYFGTIESREGEDDVSTLGDPYFGEGVNPEPRADDTVAESMISSELEMFGVNRQRLNTGTSSRPGSTITGGTRDNPNQRMYFGDDPTLEDAYLSPMSGMSAATPFGAEQGANFERVVVVAPAGKIGITIDNQTGDLPIVFGIKETSVLYGKVKVGDLLISVDEIDCRGLSAVQVSRLISSRSQNPTRTLALLRASS